MDKSDVLSQRPYHGSSIEDNTNIVLLDADLFVICVLCALEGLSMEGKEKDVLKEICVKVQEGLMEDSVAMMVKGLKDSHIVPSPLSCKLWISLK